MLTIKSGKVDAAYKRNRHKRLQSMGSMLNLSISKCFAFGNKVIGLDQTNKRLLIAEGNCEQGTSHLIELEKVKNISLKKSYGSIRAGSIRNNGIWRFLKYIGLQFEHAYSQEHTVLSLYEKGKDEETGLIKLDLTAKKLHLILSKIIEEGNAQMISVTV